jgi:2-hydroxy-3-keto-5-methylthiopentenyl-1-phosphate phosphatase
VTTTSHVRTIVLDFDGTITEVDLLQDVAAHFGDPTVVDQVDRALDEGRMTLQEEVTREYEPVTASLEDVIEWVLDRVRIRDGLPELVALARAHGWGVRVLSSGFGEIIVPVLADVGVDGMEIVANRVDARPDGWRVVWRDETVCEVCGEPCKRSGLPEGEIVYVGDGISDRCAALASHRVFATRGLARYLDERRVPFEPFVDFHDIVRALKL